MYDRYILLATDDGWQILEAVLESEYRSTISHYRPFMPPMTEEKARVIAEALNEKARQDDLRDSRY